MGEWKTGQLVYVRILTSLIFIRFFNVVFAGVSPNDHLINIDLPFHFALVPLPKIRPSSDLSAPPSTFLLNSRCDMGIQCQNMHSYTKYGKPYLVLD